MSTKKNVPPRVRRSLGPDYTGMTCLACASPSMQGLIDVNGIPYLSCESCRFRVLSLNLQRIAALRFLGRLLTNEEMRKAWVAAQVEAMGEVVAPPTTRTAPAEAESEVRRAS